MARRIIVSVALLASARIRMGFVLVLLLARAASSSAAVGFTQPLNGATITTLPTVISGTHSGASVVFLTLEQDPVPPGFPPPDGTSGARTSISAQVLATTWQTSPLFLLNGTYRLTVSSNAPGDLPVSIAITVNVPGNPGFLTCLTDVDPNVQIPHGVQAKTINWNGGSGGVAPAVNFNFSRSSTAADPELFAGPTAYPTGTPFVCAQNTGGRVPRVVVMGGDPLVDAASGFSGWSFNPITSGLTARVSTVSGTIPSPPPSGTDISSMLAGLFVLYDADPLAPGMLEQFTGTWMAANASFSFQPTYANGKITALTLTLNGPKDKTAFFKAFFPDAVINALFNSTPCNALPLTVNPAAGLLSAQKTALPGLGCELSVDVKFQSPVTITIPIPAQKLTPTVSSQSDPSGNVFPGPAVNDLVTVTGSGSGPVPTGTVTIHLCGPAFLVNEADPASGCPTGGSLWWTATLDPNGQVTGSVTPANLTSTPGLYCWRADYAGDANYLAASHTNNTTECFTVVPKLTPTISTQSTPSGDVSPGAAVKDVVTVTASGGGPVPTGTVTIHLCGPAFLVNQADPATGCPAGGSLWWTATLDANGQATGSVTPANLTSTVGLYCWRADYTGDANYLAASHTNNTTECFTVVPPPTLTAVPSNARAEASGPTGAVVTYATPTAVDGIGLSLLASCNPASGSTFPLGTTTVTCTATDAFGNTASSSFTVQVVDTRPPAIFLLAGPNPAHEYRFDPPAPIAPGVVDVSRSTAWDTGLTATPVVGLIHAGVGRDSRAVCSAGDPTAGRAAALVFDGSAESVVELAGLGGFGTDDFAISLWVRGPDPTPLAPPPGTRVLLSNRSDRPGSFFELRLTPGGTAALELNDGASSDVIAEGGAGLLDGAWHFVVAQRRGAESQLFVDGVLAATSVSASDPVNIVSTNPLLLGGGSSGGAFQIDPMRFYGQALSDDEITRSFAVAAGDGTCGITESVLEASTDNPAGTTLDLNAIVAIDTVDRNPIVACTVDGVVIDSGFVFPVGSTPIACSAQDTAGNNKVFTFVTIIAAIAIPNLNYVFISSAKVAEGDSGTTDLIFPVTIKKGTSVVETVDYFTEDLNATAGVDYMPASGTLVFNPGDTTKPIIVKVIGNVTPQEDRILRVYLTNRKGPIPISNFEATGTIVDDDTPQASIGDVAIPEGNSGTTNAVFTASLSKPAAAPVTIDFTTADGTATAGSDYTPASGVLTFVPGETAKTITVAVIGDTTPEADETFLVKLSNPVNAALAKSQGIGTIVNDDGPVPPPITIGSRPNVRAEATGRSGAAVAFIAPNAFDAVGRPVPVICNPAGSTFPLGTTTVTCAATDVYGNTASSSFTVQVVDTRAPSLALPGMTLSDHEYRFDPPAPIQPGVVDMTANNVWDSGFGASRLAGLMHTAVGRTTRAVCSANDPAAGRASALIFNGSAESYVDFGSLMESTGTGDFALSLWVSLPAPAGTPPPATTVLLSNRSNALTAGLELSVQPGGSVRFELGDGQSSLVAEGGAIPLDGTWHFIVAQRHGAELQVSVDGVLVGSDTEPFFCTLSPVTPINAANGNPLLLGGPGGGSSEAIGSLRVYATALSGEEIQRNFAAGGGDGSCGASEAVVTTLATGPDGAEVFATPEACRAIGGPQLGPLFPSAVDAVDATSTLVCTAGGNAVDSTYVFPIGSTHVRCGATDASGNTASNSFTVIVDVPPTISIADASVFEGNSGTTPAVFTVTRSGTSLLSMTVDYTTLDGTATAANHDYVPASGTLTFAPGETVKTITVAVVGDLVNEPDETFSVALLHPVNGVLTSVDDGACVLENLLPSIFATGHILNDDGPLPEIAIADASVLEGNSGTTPAVFTVTLSGASALPVSVDYATLDNTATVADHDYVPAGGTLTFAPGETVKTITVVVVGDLVNEPDETFFVALSHPVNAVLLSPESPVACVPFDLGSASLVATGRILNDDAPPPQITITNVSVFEGNSGTTPAVFTVTLSGASGLPVSVNYTTQDNTATVADHDYVAASGTLTFAPGETVKTITVAVVGDLVNEPDETFFVTLSHPVNGYFLEDGNACIAFPSLDAVGQILNDDAAMILTSPSSISTEATQSGGAAVVYAPATAISATGEAVPVRCDPPPGSTFPLGRTTVTCSASDTFGNTATTRFTVTVVDTRPPALAMPGMTLPDHEYRFDPPAPVQPGTVDVTANNVWDSGFGTALAAGLRHTAVGFGTRAVCSAGDPLAGHANALQFDGSSESYVDFGSLLESIGTRDFAVSLWINLPSPAGTAPPGTTVLLSNRSNASTAGLELSVQPSGSVRFELGDDRSNTIAAEGGVIPLDGTWHFLVAQRTGADLSLFVDGVRAGSTRGPDPTPFNVANGNPLVMGGPGGGSAVAIDPFRVYATVLAEGEIQRSFAAKAGDGTCGATEGLDTLNAPDLNGAALPALATAVDAVDRAPVVTCLAGGQPVHAGDLLPLGQTLVTCGAVDGSGNAAQDSFTVVVTAPVAAAPKLVNFSPKKGTVNDLVTLSGTNFTGATAVTFGGGVPAAFTVDSDTKITATVPLGALTGLLSVTTPAGSAQSLLDFKVAPQIDSFSPPSGPIGTVVTIIGSGFTNTVNVQVHGVAASFQIMDDSTLKTTVPSTATDGKIKVTTTVGASTSTSNFDVTTPTLVNFTPKKGTVGDPVTLSGTNFTGATAVTFGGGVPAAFTVDSDTKITATVPLGALTGLLSVTTPAGSAQSLLDFKVAPQIDSFSPPSGPIGTVVTIIGSGFTNTVNVQVHGVAASFQIMDDSTLKTTVPSTATDGKIKVTTNVGASTSTLNFDVTTPTLVNFTPKKGTVGDPVTLSGTNFTGATAVTFGGGVPAAFTVDSDTKITATVPLGALAGLLSVTTPAGSAQSLLEFQVAPTIDSVNPSAAVRGATVTVHGSGFTTAVSVEFKGLSSPFTVLDDLTIQTVVPQQAQDGKIKVTTKVSTAVMSATFDVIAPTLYNFTPKKGIVGDVVTITGSDLETTSAASISGVNATVLSVTTTAVTVAVPPGAKTGKIELTTVVGQIVSAIEFGVQPQITDFSPISGPAGAVVTIVGSGFNDVTLVRVGTTPAAFNVISDTTIQMVVPSAPSGKINVYTVTGHAVSAATFEVK